MPPEAGGDDAARRNGVDCSDRGRAPGANGAGAAGAQREHERAAKPVPRASDPERPIRDGAPISQSTARAEEQMFPDKRRSEAPAPTEAGGAPDGGAPIVSPPARRRLGVQTAIFSALTGLSRVAGLIREIVAAYFFGTGGVMSAFTIAFTIPNTVRALFADSALSAAFVPVFTELMSKGKKREAFELAGAMTGLIIVVLGLVTLLSMAVMPFVMPLFLPDKYAGFDVIAIVLSQLLFPIVVLLGVNGLVVGVLNAQDHFSIPALAPVIWNLVIIAALVGLQFGFDDQNHIYAYAIGVLVGTVVQLAMSIAAFRKIGFRMRISVNWSNPRIRQVLWLMLPVTISLGLINVNLLINQTLGFQVSVEAPAAINNAFRIYMLPQGMFSVAVATVLFPALARLAVSGDLEQLRSVLGGGTRQIVLLLTPAMAAFIVLAEPITRLIYEYGEFDAHSTAQVSEALLWFSLSLPFSGVNLLLTRTFFSLQDPWTPTKLAGITLLINAVVSGALYKPFGIAGIVLGTAVSSAAMTVLQARKLRTELNGLELSRTLRASGLMLLAAVALGAVSYGLWWGLDSLLGRSLPAQIVSVGTALIAGSAVYVGLVLVMRIPEARDITDMLSARLRRRRGASA